MEEDVAQFNKKIAKVRHEATKYDKLCFYYNKMPKARRRLNKACASVLRGDIEIDAFFQLVNKIESKVDLVKKHNRKTFLSIEENRIKSELYFQTDIKYIKNIAKNNLINLIKKQNEYNKRIQNEVKN